MTAGPARILLVRLSAVGDCVHALPVVAALRSSFPGAFLGWAIEEKAHELMAGHPCVDRFHIYPRRPGGGQGSWLAGRWKALCAFRSELRAARYEAALDLQGLTKSALVAWWSGAGLRIGFAGQDGRELSRFFYNRRVQAPAEAAHVVDRNLALLKALGVNPPARPDWVLPDYSPEQREMDRFLESCGLRHGADWAPLAVVNAGATWVTKRWRPELFAAVARGLIERRGMSVIVPWAGEAERASAEGIVREAGSPPAFLAPPTNLRQLAALLSRACLFVGNDTGPLHLAAALGVRCVAVFGASDPLRNGPYGHGHRVVTARLPCRPCWSTGCARGDLACLEQVSAPEVLARCEEALGDRRAGR